MIEEDKLIQLKKTKDKYQLEINELESNHQ